MSVSGHISDRQLRIFYASSLAPRNVLQTGSASYVKGGTAPQIG